MTSQPPGQDGQHLHRGLGRLQATALNMTNMVGVGPFITIPLLMATLGGPQAMLGWLVAALICIPDGLIWSELGAALPGSGGSYVYLRDGYGRHTWGRLLAFLFVWQFIVSGPLEIASGYIGFGRYASYLRPTMTDPQMQWLGAVLGLVNIALLYREIRSIGRLTVALWSCMLVTCAWVVGTGLIHFHPARAFDFPPHAFGFSLGFLLGLGKAATIGVYDYLGYYDVCYVAEEVREPGRVIPRAVITSVIGVAVLYVVMNLSILGTISWREFVPAEGHKLADYVATEMIHRLHGQTAAVCFTALILITTFGSCFALLLGYSRIPYAAALDGCFFQPFSRLHPRHGFPHRSLLAVGGISILCCFINLQTVIDALVACRILVQFLGQIGAVVLLRRHQPELPRPYRIWLYPLPCAVAFVGWIFVYVSADQRTIAFSLAALAVGAVAFLIWSAANREWPFAQA